MHNVRFVHFTVPCSYLLSYIIKIQHNIARNNQSCVTSDTKYIL